MRKLSLSMTLATMLVLSGCTGSPVSSLTGANTGTTTATAVGTPVIASFTPTQGGPGTVVTITGTGFDGAIASNNLVLFNGVPGLVTEATATTLKVTVPEGGSFGTLTVTVNGKTATSADSYASVLGIRTIAGAWAPASTSAADWSAYYNSTALDAAGNLYVSSSNENAVYKITPDGTLTTVAGNGLGGYLGDGGAATSARLSNPQGVAVDASGNLYIADTDNNVIRKVSNGVISTVAGVGTHGFSGDGGPADRAQLYYPNGIALDAAGNLYIADSSNQRIRKVSNGLISTVAGNGISGFSGNGAAATSARLNYPMGVAVDESGNLYIADYYNHMIRKVNEEGVISTVAGDGNDGSIGENTPAIFARLSYPQGVQVDASGSIYVADTDNGQIRKITDGIISTFAGSLNADELGDGAAAVNARLGNPRSVAVSPSGHVYIADTNNRRVRKVDAAGVISTFAGNVTSTVVSGGAALNAKLGEPRAMAEDAEGNLYIADQDRHVVWKLSNGNLTVVAGTGTIGFSGDEGPATSAKLNYPRGLALDDAGTLYVSDSGNHRIRKVSNGVISTVAGDGTGGFAGDDAAAVSAKLMYPQGIAVDASGNLYIADSNNHRIRKISNGNISTVAGNGVKGFSGDGTAAAGANLHYPGGVTVDASGNLYIADTDNHRIRKVSNGIISTVAGNGMAYESSNYRIAAYSGARLPAIHTTLYYPAGIAVDPAGNLYVADSDNHLIRKVSAGDGTISTVVGNGLPGYLGDGGRASDARLYYPQGVLLSRSGSLLIADTDNGVIRSVGF